MYINHNYTIKKSYYNHNFEEKVDFNDKFILIILTIKKSKPEPNIYILLLFQLSTFQLAEYERFDHQIRAKDAINFLKRFLFRIGKNKELTLLHVKGSPFTTKLFLFFLYLYKVKGFNYKKKCEDPKITLLKRELLLILQNKSIFELDNFFYNWNSKIIR